MSERHRPPRTDIAAGLTIGYGWCVICAVMFGGRAQRLGDPVTTRPRGIPTARVDDAGRSGRAAWWPGHRPGAHTRASRGELQRRLPARTGGHPDIRRRVRSIDSSGPARRTLRAGDVVHCGRQSSNRVLLRPASPASGGRLLPRGTAGSRPHLAPRPDARRPCGCDRAVRSGRPAAIDTAGGPDPATGGSSRRRPHSWFRLSP